VQTNKKDGIYGKITPAWISDQTVVEPVILSTRLRLARNLDHFPFPHLASDTVLGQIAKLVESTVSDRRARSLRSLTPVNVSMLTEAHKAALVDSHLVSLLHVLSGAHRIALVDQKHTVSIMVNEEDHIRIQVILPGLMPIEAWHEADKIDDALTQRLAIAYHKTYGYLTASLANAGTGMRISVMAHLPALAFLEKLSATWQAARALSTTVRGLYGEGGELHGDVYQVSNSTTIGQTEKQIVGRMRAVALFLQTEEESARHIIRSVRMDDLREQVEDSQSRLKTADALTASEAMSMVSMLRLGEMLGLNTHVSHRMFCELLTSMRGSIESIANKTDRARDVFYEDTRRPALLRNRLRQEKSMEGRPAQKTASREN
jgi:protein arginine kinase